MDTEQFEAWFSEFEQLLGIFCPDPEAALKKLKESPDVDVTAKTSDGWSVWLIAAGSRPRSGPDGPSSSGLFMECLKRGPVDVNGQDPNGHSIAMIVAGVASSFPNELPRWKKVLELKPNMNTRAKDGSNIVDSISAFRKCSWDIFQDVVNAGLTMDDEIMVSAMRNWPWQLDYFLQIGGKATAVDRNGETALTVLLDNPTLPRRNFEFSEEWTPETALAVLNKLLELGADPKVQDQQGATPLSFPVLGGAAPAPFTSLVGGAITAPGYGCKWAIMPLIEAGSLDAETGSLSQMLQRAVVSALSYTDDPTEEDYAPLDKLLSLGANLLETEKKQRWTGTESVVEDVPLLQELIASRSEHAGLAKFVNRLLFVKKTYSLEDVEAVATSHFYEQALSRATQHGLPELASFALKHAKPDGQTLVLAKVDTLQLLIDGGADLSQTYGGKDILRVAAEAEDVEKVKILLAAGAKVQKTREGNDLGALVSASMAEVLGISPVDPPLFAEGTRFVRGEFGSLDFTLGRYALWGHRHTVLEGIAWGGEGPTDGAGGPAETLTGGTILQNNFRYRFEVTPGKWHVSQITISDRLVGCVVYADGVDAGAIVGKAKAIGISNNQQHEDKSIVYVNRYDWGYHHTPANFEDKAAEAEREDDFQAQWDVGSTRLSTLNSGRFMLVDESASAGLLEALNDARIPELIMSSNCVVEREGAPVGVHLAPLGFAEYELGWYFVSNGGEGPVEAFVYDAAYSVLEGDSFELK